jgi:hypothetical protein
MMDFAKVAPPAKTLEQLLAEDSEEASARIPQ